MSRPKVSIPRYSRHAPSGQAVVYINRRRIYLGKHGTPESRARYAEVIAAHSKDEPIAPPAPVESGPTVNTVLLKFATVQLKKYRTAEGDPSAEVACFKGAIRILRELFGHSPVSTFGPLKLRKVREVMIAKGWCRKFINKQVGRVRKIFRFGVGWELVSPLILEGLRAVEPLRPGDSEAPESIPRKAVPLEHVEAAKKHLRQRNRDLVDLLIATAARPGEILSLTTQIIDQTGEVWSADLAKHKTAHHGHSRTLHFGDRAQAILANYLNPLKPTAKLFPIQRKTFGTAVKDACIKAGIPPFTPHWLRHTAVTLIADEMDMESAQRVAGHSTTAMTILYATAARKKARAAVKKLG